MIHQPQGSLQISHSINLNLIEDYKFKNCTIYPLKALEYKKNKKFFKKSPPPTKTLAEVNFFFKVNMKKKLKEGRK